jgi:hypothetical protein
MLDLQFFFSMVFFRFLLVTAIYIFFGYRPYYKIVVTLAYLDISLDNVVFSFSYVMTLFLLSCYHSILKLCYFIQILDRVETRGS